MNVCSLGTRQTPLYLLDSIQRKWEGKRDGDYEKMKDGDLRHYCIREADGGLSTCGSLEAMTPLLLSGYSFGLLVFHSCFLSTLAN